MLDFSTTLVQCRSTVRKSLRAPREPRSRLRQPERINAIPLPPTTADEQRAIAHILGTLDDKIELNRRMNETLETMARALFKSWFVDFDPVRAKAEGRAPDLASDIGSLFPDRLDAEGKPEGWRDEPLLAHDRLISGGTPKTEERYLLEWLDCVASAKDVSQCGCVPEGTERSITERGLNESAARIIPKF